MAGTADEHIRVSKRIKEALERRKREGETYNDVLARLLEDDRDLLAGFGAAADRDVTLEDVHAEATEQSAERVEQFAEGRDRDE